MESLKGKMLVASPTLLDPNFFRTVVLVVDHDAEGALGIVLNRPSETPLSDALPDDAFDPDPETLWKRVLTRQGGGLALVAAFPPHPSLN